MENFTFVRLKKHLVLKSTTTLWCLVFGFTSSFGFAPLHNHNLDVVTKTTSYSDVPFSDISNLWNPLANALSAQDCDGDGVTCEQEKKDGTDYNDPCDFILEHQDCAPSEAWKKDDCDGDGVTNGKEKEDGTDPLDPCDFILAHQNCSITDAWKKDDCDGDGVSNGKEKEDGTDPLDPCDFILEHQDCSVSDSWKKDDCDGDGVSNGKEKEDGTDPLDPCDFILEHQDCSPSEEWKKADCDGDGVTNEDEKKDGTDPLDPCDYKPESVTLPQTGDYLEADCDGDGVTNEDEKEDGTDPLDACDFLIESQTVAPDSAWNSSDCDGDGVTNEDEKKDGTDPLDPCDYRPESVTLPQTADWDALDCDGDGNPNETDPDPLKANANDDYGSTQALTEVAINILENDDYLPNNAANNVGEINLSQIGGDAGGSISFNNDTGFVNYTPTLSESNSTVTIIYQVCNVLPDPSVCASATIYIEVGANTIDAVDDTYSATLGEDEVIGGSDVLLNDTLNGSSITLADVLLTSTSTDELRVNDDGSVSVLPGTQEGTYTITYTICDIMDVDNCDTATVTVTITEGMGGNIIDAVDDAYSATLGEDEVIDGSDVLLNDTLNGLPVTLADVLLTSTPTDELRVNDDGSVSVLPGTPEGTYTITYTICDIMDVDNCDTATVTVEVIQGEDNVIDAVDDNYNAGTSGGVITGSDVLLNDTLNDEFVSLNDVILTSTPTNQLMINDNGTVTVATGTQPGTYTIEYTICEVGNPDNCDTAIVTVEVEAIEVNQMLTPNGDLKNDFLFIRGVEYIKSSTIKIFNRWGTEVFTGNNYDNVSNVFDGRVRGKSALSVNDYLPAGIYFYIFNYETEQGSFTDSEYIYLSR